MGSLDDENGDRPLSKGYGVRYPIVSDSLFEDGRVSADKPWWGPVRVSAESAPGTSKVASCRHQAVVRSVTLVRVRTSRLETDEGSGHVQPT